MKVYFSNTGCSFENEDFLRFLALTNAQEADSIMEADVIIAHFCALSTESFQTIPPHMAVLNGMREFNAKVQLYVGGCAAEVLDLKTRYPFINGVFTRRRMVEDLAKYFNYSAEANKDISVNYYNCVRIETGCARHCGFCKQAYLKMPVQSKPIDRVLADVRDVVSKGHHDIVLFAENSTEYGLDLPGNIRLIDLLKEVVEIEGVEFIYISALCIDELVLNPELVDYIRDCNKIYKVQLEIQSLIPFVRRNMRLTSTVDEVLEILDKFSKKHIIGNIMMGYPGETEGNFKKQLRLIEEHDLYYVQINEYDDTPMVYGHSFEQISKEIVHERCKKMLQLISRLRTNKAKEIKELSIKHPLDCIRTTSGKLELVGYSAIAEIGNVADCVSSQIIRVVIDDLKTVAGMFDYEQSLILGGKMV